MNNSKEPVREAALLTEREEIEETEEIGTGEIDVEDRARFPDLIFSLQ